jgi:GH35 family endo-1,4-beta-xylanase
MLNVLHRGRRAGERRGCAARQHTCDLIEEDQTTMTQRNHAVPRTYRTVIGLATAALVVGFGATLPSSAATTTLKSLADAKGKDVGFAFDPSRLSESGYKNIADTEFNLVVPENAMKWDATEATQNTFTFSAGDQVASYAASTSKELYGHTLVWHSQLPGWVSNLDGTALLAAVKNHIANVAGHFKGKTASWDQDSGHGAIVRTRSGTSFDLVA